MRSMFWGATSFIGDISKRVLSRVKNMNKVFYGAPAFSPKLRATDSVHSQAHKHILESTSASISAAANTAAIPPSLFSPRAERKSAVDAYQECPAKREEQIHRSESTKKNEKKHYVPKNPGGATMATTGFEVFYDGDCPLCKKEIRMLQWMDSKNRRIVFTDIAAPDFNAEKNTGKTQAELMAEIYGRLPSGHLVKGIEVFRQLYGAVGLGFLLAPTTWPVVAPLCEKAYQLFARNRLRLTGRCNRLNQA